MTAITAPATLHRERSAIGRTVRQVGVDSAYVLLGLPLAIVAFVIVVTGIALGAGLLITLLGIPVLAATVFAARGLAEVERVRIPPVLRRERIGVRYKSAGPNPSGWRRLVTPLTDAQS